MSMFRVVNSLCFSSLVCLYTRQSVLFNHEMCTSRLFISVEASPIESCIVNLVFRARRAWIWVDHSIGLYIFVAFNQSYFISGMKPIFMDWRSTLKRCLPIGLPTVEIEILSNIVYSWSLWLHHKTTISYLGYSNGFGVSSITVYDCFVRYGNGWLVWEWSTQLRAVVVDRVPAQLRQRGRGGGAIRIICNSHLPQIPG